MTSRRSGTLSGLFTLVLVAAQAATAAGAMTGRVVHVIDGNGLVVLVGERRVTVRLADIDAPKQREAYAIASRQSLSAICGGELARLEVSGKDRSGGVLAQVTCAGMNANSEQVRRGMAWVTDRATDSASPLRAFQSEAREARRGLWSKAERAP
jgi:endonuclease YncB( thermonuclease family)